jgi:hypothetical protein
VCRNLRFSLGSVAGELMLHLEHASRDVRYKAFLLKGQDILGPVQLFIRGWVSSTNKADHVRYRVYPDLDILIY